jgi:hypothetical protein
MPYEPVTDIKDECAFYHATEKLSCTSVCCILPSHFAGFSFHGDSIPHLR